MPRVAGNRLRRLAPNLALAAASVLAAVAVLEGGARLGGFQPRGTWSSRCYEHVDGVGHLFVPGYRGTMYKGISTGWREIPIRINAHGLRGAEFPRAKPAGVRRILLLGDSLAFGYLLEERDSVSAQLQTLLDGRAGAGRTHVVNAGVPGYDLANVAGLLERRGLAFAPDVAVVVTGPGDVHDAGTRKNAAGERVDLGRELALYRLVQTSALANAMQWLGFRALRLLDPTLPLTRGLHAEVLSAELRRAWDRYEGDVARLAALAAAHRLPLLLVLVPGELQLFSESTTLGRRWADLARRHGVGFVDLLPAFRPVRRHGLYLPADGHPNAEASAIAAREIAQWLAAHGW